MRLTTKGRYAVTAMLDLAFHGEKRPVTLTDIAKRQHISLSYLEQLFARLRRAGMVEGVRGPGGGYQLSRTAAEISIADIIAAVDETIDSTRCGGKANCQNNQPCLTHDLWLGLSDQIREYLASISLHDVLQRKNVRQVAERQDKQVVLSGTELGLRRDARA
ncbi:Fe-S cluster assembly transcriptional regulator IscR [Candidatus Methylocalor cossyra]|uniref:DNA-binding transcriptional dual regulator IscR n=1 Tax=Candidatus Methylocalor cossyra TaxID=3108543 RepID=A0ABP1C6M4_9GAMM